MPVCARTGPEWSRKAVMPESVGIVAQGWRTGLTNGQAKKLVDL